MLATADGSLKVEAKCYRVPRVERLADLSNNGLGLDT